MYVKWRNQIQGNKYIGEMIWLVSFGGKYWAWGWAAENKIWNVIRICVCLRVSRQIQETVFDTRMWFNYSCSFCSSLLVSTDCDQTWTLRRLCSSCQQGLSGPNTEQECGGRSAGSGDAEAGIWAQYSMKVLSNWGQGQGWGPRGRDRAGYLLKDQWAGGAREVGSSQGP